MKYLIIGNGVAGDEASIMIGKNDATAEIKLISESINYFYYKPKLINYLANEISLNKFTIHKKAFYEKMNIKNIPGTKITKINPDKNIVIAEDKTEYEYDKLLLATGSRAFIPAIKGANKNGVFTIREVEDCDNILEYIKDKNSIVVIGGGLLGLETANSLRSLNKKVTVIEYFSTLLPRQLDNDGANLLKKMLEKKGLNFILPGIVEIIEGKDKVEKVILKSGKEIKADAVIVSAGIRGRIELAQDIGIKINKGIVVNDFMQTSVENIYSAGDSVEHNGKLYGIWKASKEQGKIAGLNMVGIKTKYNGTLFSNILKVTGIDLYSAGNFDSKNGEILISKNGNEYIKFIIKNNQLIGAIVLGNANAVKIASKDFEGKASVEELKNLFDR
ncbi:NAD(P)/FAD-dependent oxidoreductase [candidate division KSB1 bacterium]|nr:NAD(P)/FAD-dependent oxidoreductase [candidate division KSB1 bacterium]